MLRSVIAIIGAVTLATVGIAQTYSNKQQRINVGIVILDSAKPALATQGRSAAPFAWFNLDTAKNIKPAGWTFVNPHVASTVSPAELSRWTEIIAPSTNLPAVDERITKNTAPYWEVFLDSVSDADIVDYNVLLVNPTNFAALNPIERERLRRFVDAGGILWVDPAALTGPLGSLDQTNNFPAPFVLGGNLVGLQDNDFSQPILTKPFELGTSDLNILNSDPQAAYMGTLDPINLTSEGAGPIGGYFNSVIADYLTAEPFTRTNGKNTSTITRIGEGFVVVTARGASIKLNRTQNSATYKSNTGYYADGGPNGPLLGPDGVAAAKFAINLISLGTEYRQSQGGSRKSNSEFLDLQPPLLNRFALENLPGPLTSSSAPVLYKGMLVFTVGPKLYVFDAHPSTDLDGDGNPDEGIVDYSNGFPYDEIWESNPAAGNLSTPVCAGVPDNPGGSLDEVFATDTNGNLHTWNLRTFSNGSLSGGPIAENVVSPPGGPAKYSPGVVTPIAPTIDEGVVYVADTQQSGVGGYVGRVWAVDARTGVRIKSPALGGTDWMIGGATVTSTNLGDFSGSPVIGYIPKLDNSGASDKVLYIPFRPAAGGNGSCGFDSIWIGARGERPSGPTDVSVIPNALSVRTGSAAPNAIPIYLPLGPDPRGVKLTVLDSTTGNPWSAAVMAQYFQSPVGGDNMGTLFFPMKAGQDAKFQAGLDANTLSVRVDYNLDWGLNPTDTTTLAVLRGQVHFPDIQTGPTRTVIGNLALSPRGTLFAVVADPPAKKSGGSLFAIRERGRGKFNVVTRWDLYPAHQIQLGSIGVAYDEVLFDKDPVNQFVEVGQDWDKSADRRMSKFLFTGGPTIRNGEVFVTATAEKTFNLAGLVKVPKVPVTILMCFNAEPVAPEIAVGSFPTDSTLTQPDFLRNDYVNFPNSLSAITTLSFRDVSYDSNSGVVQFSSLATETGPGNITLTECLNLSQPVVLKRGQLPDLLIEPSLGGRWSPLLWYQVFEGASSESGVGPIVTGDSVFVGLSSALPSILNGGGIALSGIVAATEAKIPPNDVKYLRADDYAVGAAGSYRPWLKQLWTLPQPGSDPKDLLNPFDPPNPHILWPQLAGLKSLSDYQIRLNETVLGSTGGVTTKTVGLAAGEGTLAAVGDGGIYAFDRADFLVCDEGRVARFDPSGNAIFSSQAFVNGGEGSLSNAGVLNTLVRPTKAYDLGGNTMVVVDTGGNRIVKLDAAGHELRSIDRFRLDPDPRYLPEGYRANETGFQSEGERLKAPRDVVTFSEYRALPNGGTPIASGQTALEYWVHYLIADSGNHRLVDLVDRFVADPVTRRVGSPVVVPEIVIDPKSTGTGVRSVQNVPQVGVLFWHSPAAVSGKGFDYNSLNRVAIPLLAGVPRYIYVAGVSNGETAVRSSTTEGLAEAPGANGSGAIVIFDPLRPATPTIFNRMKGLPDTTGIKLWDQEAPVPGWYMNGPLNRTNIVNGTPVLKPFSNLASVTARLDNTAGKPVVAIMIAEGDGVYEVTYDPAFTYNQNPPDALDVRWMITNEAYRVIKRPGALGVPDGKNARNLRATFARRLDNGDVLIVNGYYGLDRSGTPFQGEIVELGGKILDPTNGYGYNPAFDNLGFGTQAIRFTLGPVQGVRGLVLPTFADRR